jgi:hypothetical protein
MACGRAAYAYIDPGTGSYVFQLLVAGVFALSFAIKVYWRRLRSFFGHRAPGKDEDDEP